MFSSAYICTSINQNTTIMTKEEVKKKIEEIEKAIEEKKYTVSYDLPNFIEECTGIDGSEFLVVKDLDDARNSNDFGGCEVKIAGITFYESLEPYDPMIECEFLDEVEEMEYDDDDTEDYVEIIRDLIESIPEFVSPLDMDDIDGQVEAYKKMADCDIEDYYWYEDRLPVDEDDFIPIEDSCVRSMEYNGKLYYVVEEDELEIIAVDSFVRANRFSQYPAVKFILEDGNVKDVVKYSQWYNSTEGELEEEEC